MALTSSEKLRIKDWAKGHIRGSPGEPFERLIDSAFRHVRGVRLKKPVEDAPVGDQVDWFETASVVAAARAEVLKDGGLRGLVHELRALVTATSE